MHDEHASTLESWVSLLSFSTRFICDKARARSIRELEAIQSLVDPVERIVLAVRYNIPQWLSAAYQELCQRQDSLSEGEGERLGLSTAIKLDESARDTALWVRYAQPTFRFQDGSSSTSVLHVRVLDKNATTRWCIGTTGMVLGWRAWSPLLRRGVAI